MEAIEDQSLTTHTRKHYKKKENHHHNKKKDKKQKKFIKYPCNIRCYTCDEKGHLARDYMLYYEMALLHPSTDTECVGTQKDTMDGSFQKHIDEHMP